MNFRKHKLVHADSLLKTKDLCNKPDTTNIVAIVYTNTFYLLQRLNINDVMVSSVKFKNFTCKNSVDNFKYLFSQCSSIDNVLYSLKLLKACLISV